MPRRPRTPRTPRRPGRPRTPRGARSGGRYGAFAGGMGMRGAPWFQQLMMARAASGGGDDDAAEDREDALERALESSEESSSSSGSSFAGSRSRPSAPRSTGSSGGGSRSGGSSKKVAAKPALGSIPNGPQQAALKALIDGGADPEEVKAQHPEFAGYIDALSSGQVGAGEPDSEELAGATDDAAELVTALQTDPDAVDLEATERVNERTYGEKDWQKAKERTYEDSGVDLGMIDPDSVAEDPSYIPELGGPDGYVGLGAEPAPIKLDKSDPLERALDKGDLSAFGYEGDPYEDEEFSEEDEEEEEDEDKPSPGPKPK